tara:strand:+ start:6012 stop:6179 length:168 start_codon:yes stop_codon:yes gene_type:complete
MLEPLAITRSYSHRRQQRETIQAEPVAYRMKVLSRKIQRAVVGHRAISSTFKWST